MAHTHRTPGLLRSLSLRLLMGGLPILGLGLALGSGCVYTEMYGGHDQEACLDDFFDCMDDADGPEEIEACEAVKEVCLDSCDGAGDGHGDPGAGADTDGGGDPGDTGAGDDPGDTGAGDSGDAGDAGDGPGDTSGDEPDPACFELHATCVAQATTIADVEACETLFDHCLEADDCDHTCEPTCPDPGVSACLDVYEACATVANDAGAVAACAAGFDACVGELDDSACVPQDPAVVDACLEQHALCTECIDGSEDLWLCKEVFDTCVAGQ